MKHLDALCCDNCRAKVAVIELRAHASPDRFLKLNAESVVQAFTDRSALLAMVEGLLSTVAAQRANHRTLVEVALTQLTAERAEVVRKLQQVIHEHVPAGEP